MSEKNAVSRYLDTAVEMLTEMDSTSLDRITGLLYSCLDSGCKILLCGNGGSASDVSHFAGELVCRFRRDREAIAAIALTSDSAVITAIANDFGYERVFSRQVEALGKKGDILIAVSTSGTSSNIILAAEKARDMGIGVIAFTSALCANPGWADLHWKSSCDSTSHTQEQMLVAFHAICHGLEDLLAEKTC